MNQPINPNWPIYFGTALILIIVGLVLMITNNIVWVPFRDQMELNVGVLVVFSLACIASGLLGVCMTASTEWWLRLAIPPVMIVVAAIVIGSIAGVYLGVSMAEGCYGTAGNTVVRCRGFEGLYELRFREIVGPNLLQFEIIQNR